MSCFYTINHSYLKKSDNGVELEGWITISLDANMKAAPEYSNYGYTVEAFSFFSPSNLT